jgi:hypothetical protein
MSGFAFIWIFLVKVREAIEDNSIKATGQAFVSSRLMINVKRTYEVYRTVKNGGAMSKGKLSNQALLNPKTIIQSMETFFALFKQSTKEAILNKVDFDGFKRIVEQKDSMPYNEDAPNFDTPQELAEGKKLVKAFQDKIKNQI